VVRSARVTAPDQAWQLPQPLGEAAAARAATLMQLIKRARSSTQLENLGRHNHALVPGVCGRWPDQGGAWLPRIPAGGEPLPPHCGQASRPNRVRSLNQGVEPGPGCLARLGACGPLTPPHRHTFEQPGAIVVLGGAHDLGDIVGARAPQPPLQRTLGSRGRPLFGNGQGQKVKAGLSELARAGGSTSCRPAECDGQPLVVR